MTRPMVGLVLTVLLAACGGASSGAGMTSTAPTTPVSLMHVLAATVTPDGQDADASFTVHNGTGAPDRLVGVTCPCATAAEIHGADATGDLGPVAGVTLPPDEAVEFAPGGPHVVLVDVAGPLTPGSTVTLTLTFAHAAPVDVVATVAAPPTPSAA